MRRRHIITFKTVFTLLVIFVGAIFVTISSAMIGDINVKINDKRAKLQNQREVNAALRAQSTQKYTLEEVERLARENLGMNKPDPSQIIYINVPKQSYVVISDDIISAEDSISWWDKLSRFFLFK